MPELADLLAPATTSHDVANAVRAAGVASIVAAGFARLASDRSRFEVFLGGSVDAFFDLASLTKSMTALAVARAGIARDTPLGVLVEETRGSPVENASIEAVLSHRAGLDAHVALWEHDGDRLKIAARSCGGDPRAAVYSDLGYILAGVALARRLDVVDAGEAIRRLIVEPLELCDSLGTAGDLERRAQGFLARVAPTEGLIRGTVHDENAAAISGTGGCGHAGMFGTLGAVLAFASAAHDAILRGRGPLACGDLRWLVDPRPGGDLRAGFDGKSPTGSSAGTRAGAAAFGHLGFTGTSFWIDPDRAAVVSLLTNRVHPTRENALIRTARPLAHDALWHLADTRFL